MWQMDDILLGNWYVLLLVNCNWSDVLEKLCPENAVVAQSIVFYKSNAICRHIILYYWLSFLLLAVTLHTYTQMHEKNSIIDFQAVTY